MKHAGIHFPENAGGEHPNRETIAGMPGMAGATLICSPSARYHYDFLRKRNPSALVVWRAIPRQGKLPAQLGWDARRVADECLNLWAYHPTEAPGAIHGGIEWFLPLNELQFVRENGGPFPGYAVMADNLQLLRLELRKRLPGVRLLFPAWVPADDGDRLDDWRLEASAWDGLVIHCYGSAEAMRARYDGYRSAFPNHPIFVGEWNANHEGHDERAALQMWAEVADTDPLFLGAAYYIWETLNAGERDLSIWGNGARYGLFLDPPIITRVPDPETPPMTEIEAFIRDAAQKRGIDPDIAVKVAKSEGGVTEYAAHGDFETGDSWWPFQLHYGGPEYPQFGTVAGMGNGFTALTGWQPGDPAAWRDATRYALNRAKASGWGAWYGAAHVGVGTWDGIDRNHLWDAAAERWDYEDRAQPIPPEQPKRVTYNPNTPPILQDDPWSCAPTALRWALTALGRNPGPTYIEDLLVRDGVVSKDLGLLDGSGAGLAAWIGRQGDEYYGADGFYGNSEPSVTYNGVALEGDHQYPVLIGGRQWNHWCGVRGYDATRNVLLLANPSPGWQGVGQEMTPEQFAALGPFSMVRVLHPDLPGVGAPVVEPPVIVDPPKPADTRLERARVLAEQLLAVLNEPPPA